MIKQISDDEIYLLIKYSKSVLCRVAKSMSYIEDARRLKVNLTSYTSMKQNLPAKVKNSVICSFGIDRFHCVRDSIFYVVYIMIGVEQFHVLILFL